MKNLLVLDKNEYSSRNSEFLNLMNSSKDGDNEIIYTSYEDDTIRKVRNYKYIGSFLQHILYWKKSYNYAKTILKNHYDNIYCINPIVGFFLGLKNRRSRLVLGGFLFEPKKNKLYYWLRKKITRKALKGVDKTIVYGNKEVEYYQRIFGSVTQFVFLKYGIDFDNTTTYNGKKLAQDYFFSGGGSNRDYGTLVDAFNRSKVQEKIVVATQPWRLQGMDISKVDLLSDVVVENFGSVLGRSKALILSLTNSDISAGHMVMFQAMSLGIPIIVNDIPAIRDYVDEKQVTFYKSGDVNVLSEIINNFDNSVYKDKAIAAKEKYNQELTFAEFVKRIVCE